jgi:hypothetical protein
MPWLAGNTLSPHQEDIDKTLPQFVLNMLSRVITAEEHFTKRRSCMRLFVRMDVSVFQRQREFHYIINELTRSHQTALFQQWDSGSMEMCIQDLAKTLHYVTYQDVVERKLHAAV